LRAALSEGEDYELLFALRRNADVTFLRANGSAHSRACCSRAWDSSLPPARCRRMPFRWRSFTVMNTCVEAATSWDCGDPGADFECTRALQLHLSPRDTRGIEQ
jgi:hypothetical protein